MTTTVLIVFVLVLNAVFWGAFSHKTHCRVSNALHIPCIPHRYHQILGATCAISALSVIAVIAAKRYF